MAFSKDHKFSSKEKALEKIQQVINSQALNSQNNLKLLGYSSLTQKSLCSTSFVVRAFYEFPKSDLNKISLMNKKEGKPMSGQLLQKAAFDSLQGLHNLHQNNQTHGNIQPMFIGKHKNDVDFLLMQDLYHNEDFERIQLNNLVDNDNVLMSPELYYKLEGKHKEQEVNPKKNDLFSLGASILTSGNEQSIKDCYEKNGSFNNDVLIRHLQNFDSKYKAQQPMLSKLVWNLMEPDPEKRPGTEVLIQSH